MHAAKTQDSEEQARRRVETTPELKAHEDTILYDWPNRNEHMRWVATAPVEEIVDWAKSVEQAQLVEDVKADEYYEPE